MSYKVDFANLPLHNYIDILNVKRSILPSRENFTKEIPGVHGEYYLGYKYAPREITLECVLKAKSREEYADNIKDLAYILDVSGPCKLIIDDTPDRYCYAVPTGKMDPDKVKHNAKFDLHFICYDPIIYSVDSDYFYGDGSKKVSVSNNGSLEAYPIVSIGFQNTAHFLQCTNPEGKTVLVGLPPSVDKNNAQFNPEVLVDDCTTLAGWNPIGNIVDGSIVEGDTTINGGGYAIIAGNYGSGDKWHGPGKRKNLQHSVNDFLVKVRMAHSSQGDLNYIGAGPNPPSTGDPGGGGGPTYVKYKIVASPSLRIREGRGTNTKQIGSIPNYKVVDVCEISGGWGKTTYNGVTGYICMEYTRIYNESSGGGSGSYKINATPSLRIRSGRGTNYKQIGSIPNNKVVTVTDIADNWGKTTYGGKTGYISMQYAISQGNSRSVQLFADEENNNETREDRIGKVEVYGFDANGVKLFKFSMRDTSEWYEYSEPEVQIGNNTVLDDNKTVPSPRTKTITEDEKSVIKKIDSGQFGDWNNFDGWFTIQRKTVNGNQAWFAKIEKIGGNGSIERSIQTSELINGSYPKGALTNIVIYFGSYAQNIPVDVMNISEIRVTDIGEPPKPEENIPLFKNGDELTIDFSTRKVELNKLPFMQDLDIGSQFFSIPVGSSQMICASDDANIDVEVSLQKRWI